MSVVPLVQNEALEAVSRSFREYSQSQASLAAVVGGLLGAAAVGALVFVLLSGRERLVGRRIFRRLARASGLAKGELSLLVLVSRRVLPDNPPEIFVRRSLFEGAVADMNADAAIVQSIRKKIYGR